METAILILIVSMSNVACFYFGAKVRQTVDKGKELENPVKNPLQVWQEHREKKEADKEARRLEIIQENLEKYDGTEAGQKDIPE
jgi:hypothetical protein